MPVLVRAAALAAVFAVSGCLPSGSVVAPPESIRPDPAEIAALRDSLGAAPSPAARRAVAVRALRAAGVTPLAGDLFTRGVRAPLVGGFVPGRAPSKAAELVVVGASLDDPGAADVLGAVRALVALSLVQTAPERTVQVVFWSAPLGPADGLEAALRSPLWPRDAVASAVVLGGGAALPDSVGGAAVVSVSADGADTAARLLRTVLARSSEPPAIPNSRP